MSLKIRTRTVGVHFATVGQVVDGNGQVVAETTEVGYGNTGRALEMAQCLVDKINEREESARQRIAQRRAAGLPE
jgi:hypothetical protein